MFGTWSDELPKKALEVAISATGFWIALGIHSWIERRRDDKTFKSMLKAVKAELNSNITVINTSYAQFFDKESIILKDFSTIVVSQALANPLFISRLKEEDMKTLSQYQRNLELANSYRRAYESIAFAPKPDTGWKKTIKKFWNTLMKDEVKSDTKEMGIICGSSHVAIFPQAPPE